MPSVGHYANMSRHPKSVKLAILEFVEDRLRQITEELGGHLVGVYAPINSEWDMLVILEVESWEQYMAIYGAYFDTDNYKRTDIQNERLARFPHREEEGVFSASSSKTVIYYTAKHLRERVFKHLPDQS
jgi:hypothetical protein